MSSSHHYSHSQSIPRHSILPPSSTAATPSAGPSSMSAAKTRQYANLQAQLEQLNANLADTQNLLRMTSVQAEDMRFLGGYVGALFMGSAKVLGEEGVKGNADKKEGES
ncbi:DASH complex subunit Hsk3 like-domain-containing protein [Aspergillus coremiiformis]|uniref:DASH complex subunit Hsk3 like-domain-containing protein n=1 Tax=Aspergillus coremiiformis TaxID=138285 RepID=A0A5N6YZJ6_9EURO|nr:DASH complex subunit Hsk3 like-domain-containing protein [Aspergillus coremiiformis]